MEITLNSVERTREFAACLAGFLTPGMVLCLTGDLGAGKTTFTQALAAALGITEPVTSPSFTIVHEYHSGRYPLYHMDVYRVQQAEELDDFGFDEYFAGKALVVVEWAERVEALLPEQRIRMGLYRSGDENQRVLKLSTGTALEQRFAAWIQKHWKG